ncbi:MAG TPA: hypothetical protein VKS98_11405 [Chthoniobacterales bacterium]|nr:hypothetical protein [Chthoniobacterales bacterium]
MNKFRVARITFATLFALVLISNTAIAIKLKWPWQHETPAPEPSVAPSRVARPVQSGGLPPPDDTSRFLAGMPVSKDSPLAPLTSDPAWQEHAANFEKAFAKLNMRQLAKLRAWEGQYFPEAQQNVPVAYYMFSGPDFLYVDQFFPKADVYILCGKESLGPPPDPLRAGNLGAALHNLEEAMHSSLRFSFFITKDMKVDLQSQELKGTIPILYVFLARANKSIKDVTYGSLNESGNFQPSRPGTGGTPGVRIQFADNHSSHEQTLYYFTTDISDGGISSAPGFLRFCDHFGVGGSILKASSYLMFENGFSRIRNFILDHSKVIVQDDAGIPISYFDRDKWNIRVFGNYLGPIDIFRQHNQPKLAELYQQSAPPPLDFNFGYRWKREESNLTIASRL